MTSLKALSMHTIDGVDEDHIQNLLLCYQNDQNQVIDSMLDALVQGKRSVEDDCLIRSPQLITIFLHGLLPILHHEQRAERHVRNFEELSLAKTISLLLALLFKQENGISKDGGDDQQQMDFEEEIILTIERIAFHCITIQDYWSMIAFLAQSTSTRHRLRIMECLEKLCKAPPQPRSFFDFNSNESGIVLREPLPMPSKKGFTLVMSIRVDDASRGRKYCGTLFSFRNGIGNGLSVSIENGGLVIRSFNRGSQSNEASFFPKNTQGSLWDWTQWTWLCIIHNKNFIFSDKLSVFMNGVLVYSTDMKYADPGTNAGGSNIIGSDMVGSYFQGQMYGISMFSFPFKAEEVSFLYHATYSGQGAISPSDVNPVGGYVCARLEISNAAYSKLIFAYDAKNCSQTDGVCFDSGPLKLHGWLQRGTQLVRATTSQHVTVLTSGSSVLLPFFTNKQIITSIKLASPLNAEQFSSKELAMVLTLFGMFLRDNIENRAYAHEYGVFDALAFLLRGTSVELLNTEVLRSVRRLCEDIASDKELHCKALTSTILDVGLWLREGKFQTCLLLLDTLYHLMPFIRDLVVAGQIPFGVPALTCEHIMFELRNILEYRPQTVAETSEDGQRTITGLFKVAVLQASLFPDPLAEIQWKVIISELWEMVEADKFEEVLLETLCHLLMVKQERDRTLSVGGTAPTAEDPLSQQLALVDLARVRKLMAQLQFTEFLWLCLSSASEKQKVIREHVFILLPYAIGQRELTVRECAVIEQSFRQFPCASSTFWLLLQFMKGQTSAQGSKPGQHQGFPHMELTPSVVRALPSSPLATQLQMLYGISQLLGPFHFEMTYEMESDMVNSAGSHLLNAPDCLSVLCGLITLSHSYEAANTLTLSPALEGALAVLADNAAPLHRRLASVDTIAKASSNQACERMLALTKNPAIPINVLTAVFGAATKNYAAVSGHYVSELAQKVLVRLLMQGVCECLHGWLLVVEACLRLKDRPVLVEKIFEELLTIGNSFLDPLAEKAGREPIWVNMAQICGLAVTLKDVLKSTNGAISLSDRVYEKLMLASLDSWVRIAPRMRAMEWGKTADGGLVAPATSMRSSIDESSGRLRASMNDLQLSPVSFPGTPSLGLVPKSPYAREQSQSFAENDILSAGPSITSAASTIIPLTDRLFTTALDAKRIALQVGLSAVKKTLTQKAEAPASLQSSQDAAQALAKFLVLLGCFDIVHSETPAPSMAVEEFPDLIVLWLLPETYELLVLSSRSEFHSTTRVLAITIIKIAAAAAQVLSSHGDAVGEQVLFFTEISKTSLLDVESSGGYAQLISKWEPLLHLDASRAAAEAISGAHSEYLSSNARLWSGALELLEYRKETESDAATTNGRTEQATAVKPSWMATDGKRLVVKFAEAYKTRCYNQENFAIKNLHRLRSTRGPWFWEPEESKEKERAVVSKLMTTENLLRMRRLLKRDEQGTNHCHAKRLDSEPTLNLASSQLSPDLATEDGQIIAVEGGSHAGNSTESLHDSGLFTNRMQSMRLGPSGDGAVDASALLEDDNLRKIATLSSLPRRREVYFEEEDDDEDFSSGKQSPAKRFNISPPSGGDLAALSQLEPGRRPPLTPPLRDHSSRQLLVADQPSFDTDSQALDEPSDEQEEKNSVKSLGTGSTVTVLELPSTPDVNPREPPRVEIPPISSPCPSPTPVLLPPSPSPSAEGALLAVRSAVVGKVLPIALQAKDAVVSAGELAVEEADSFFEGISSLIKGENNNPNSQVMIKGRGRNHETSMAEETEVFSTDANLVRNMRVISGRLSVTLYSITFQGQQLLNDLGVALDCTDSRTARWMHKKRQWRLEDISQIYRRRFFLKPTAMEIFTRRTGKAYFFDFPTSVNATVYKHIIAQRSKLSLKQELLPKRLRTPPAALRHSGWTKKWTNYEISTFEYLMCLNTAAGRTYNDLTQYPVFPWVLADYNSESLDLTRPESFRDLTKPIGALNPTRFEGFMERYNSFDDPEIPKFMYGSHYSNVGVVLFYLIRVEPFSTYALQIQGDRFDHADRLFHSVEETWNHCLSSYSDLKELTPEWYYLPEFLQNVNGLPLGRRQDGTVLGDVVLPKWASSAHEFVKLHRQALESSYVSQNIHHWIDLVFGYKQRGQEAIEANNVFFHLTYEGTVDLEVIKDPVQLASIKAQIVNFGQTPSQLIVQPHPARPAPPQEYLSSYLFKDKDTETLEIVNERPLVIFQPSRNSSQQPIVGIFFVSPHQLAVIDGSGLLMWHKYAPAMLSKDETRSISASRDRSPMPLSIEAAALHRRPHTTWSQRFAVMSRGEAMITTGHFDYTAKAFQLSDGTVVQSLRQHRAHVNCVAWSHRIQTVVLGSDDGTVSVWDTSPSGHSSSSKGFTPLNLFKAAAPIQVINEDRNPLNILYGHDQPVIGVAICSSFGLVASMSRDGTVLLHSVQTGNFVRSLDVFPAASSTRSLADSDPSGPHSKEARLILATEYGNIIVQKGNTLLLFHVNGQKIASVDYEPIISLALSTNHRYLIAITGNGITAFKTVSLKIAFRIYYPSAPTAEITSLVIAPDMKCAVAGLQNGQLVLYNMQNAVQTS